MIVASPETYMRRALELATLSRGDVSPNPMVGCVIVYEGTIIGEGWHQRYGEAHAEVNAVQSVADKDLLKRSTVYVTLEPCSHFGKTPPCADLLVSHSVARVVICNVDSNPLVGGKGIQKLKAAGVEVMTGVLEDEGRFLNRRFFTFMEKKRPYIILKWAQTADGFIARKNFDSKWISNEYARMLVHKWRAEEDAILVGSNTALHDNPMLNVRDWSGRHPVRIVLDRKCSLPGTLNLFDGKQPTICYNTVKDEMHHNLEFKKVAELDFIQQVVDDLHVRKIQSLIVEGGAQVLSEFIMRGLWDEARVFRSQETFGSGISAPTLDATLQKTIDVATDKLDFYFRKN